MRYVSTADMRAIDARLLETACHLPGVPDSDRLIKLASRGLANLVLDMQGVSGLGSAFTLAAFFAGIAGGLYAHQIGMLSAKTFGFNKSIEYLVMVVLGGMGSITGSIISSAVLVALPEFLRGFKRSAAEFLRPPQRGER